MPARLLDEPESALSFENCLALGAALHALARRNDAQVLLATHSPVLAAIPGARLLELGPLGWAESTWEDLRLVGHWRASSPTRTATGATPSTRGRSPERRTRHRPLASNRADDDGRVRSRRGRGRRRAGR